MKGLKTMLKDFLAWLRSVYSEPDGTGSSTRLVISALVAFAIVAGLSFAYLVHIKTITIEHKLQLSTPICRVITDRYNRASLRTCI